MPTIEFHTAINNGVIAVPPEHLPLLAGSCATVIVVPDAKPTSAPHLISAWQGAAQAAEALRETGYDFEAWREQRQFDGEHDIRHLP